MNSRIFLRLFTFLLAFLVLGFTIARFGGVKYAFEEKKGSGLKNAAEDKDVLYGLPYPGPIDPENPLWGIKVLRDRLRFRMAESDPEKAYVALELADKRLVNAMELWEKGEVNKSLETFEKAEGYFKTSFYYAQRAWSFGVLDHDLVRKLCFSSLKHRQILEMALAESTDEVRPLVHKMLTSSKEIYIETKSLLESAQADYPKDPF